LQKVGGLEPTFHFLLDHHLWIRLAQQGRILHIPQAWAAARYHPEAKNRSRAAEFGKEAFRILEWAEHDGSLKPVLERVKRRALASAHRLDARYQLDGGRPAAALSAWTRALFIHPPTALARMNLLISSILGIFGLNRLRELVLLRRKDKYHLQDSRENK